MASFRNSECKDLFVNKLFKKFLFYEKATELLPDKAVSPWNDWNLEKSS